MTSEDTHEIDALSPLNLLADAFAGRMPELDWLADGLTKGAHLLLQGPDGMGKTTLIEKAAEWLTQKTGGQLLPIDATLNPKTIVERLNAWAHQLSESFPSELNPQLPNPSNASPENPNDLLSVLKTLDGVAGRMAAPLGVCFDNFRNPPGDGVHPLGDQLAQACRGLRHLGLVVSTPENHVSFAEEMAKHQLGPIDPSDLAATINRHFEKLAAPDGKIGEACVQWGGPLTSEIMGLARRTWEVAKDVGAASAATVRAVADEGTRLRSSEFGQFWENLPQNERKVLGEICQGARDWCTPEHLSQVAGASQAIAGLLGKGGVLGVLPAGALYILDSALRNWVGQASLHLDTSASVPANGAKNFQFNFGMSASATRLQPTH